MLEEEDHPYTDDISSPIAAQLLDFCDDGGADLFAAVNNATSDMFTASSEDGSTSSTTTPPGPCSHDNNAAPFSPMPSFDDSTLTALLEEDESAAVTDGELLLPIEYQYAAAAAVGVEPQMTEQEQFGQLAVSSAEHAAALQTQMASELMQHLAPSAYGNDCFAAAAAMGAGGGGYVGLDEGLCQPPPGALLPGAGMAETAAVQGGCFFGAGGMVMPAMGMDEIGEFQRMMEGAGGALVATHSPDAASMTFGGNAGEMQMSGSPGRLPAATEALSLEDTNFKSARISVEERREKIHRYIKKRNERNFSKKIKYACRKTLADSRPRVRGRFAKNDDYGEPSRPMQNEEYEQIAMKGDDILDPDELQALIRHVQSHGGIITSEKLPF